MPENSGSSKTAPKTAQELAAGLMASPALDVKTIYGEGIQAGLELAKVGAPVGVLSRRDYFALAIIQALLTRGDGTATAMARRVTTYVDAFIEALDRSVN